MWYNFNCPSDMTTCQLDIESICIAVTAACLILCTISKYCNTKKPTPDRTRTINCEKLSKIQTNAPQMRFMLNQIIAAANVTSNDSIWMFASANASMQLQPAQLDLINWYNFYLFAEDANTYRSYVCLHMKSTNPTTFIARIRFVALK